MSKLEFLLHWFKSDFLPRAALPLLLLMIWAIVYRRGTQQRGFIARDLMLHEYNIDRSNPMNLVHMSGRRDGFWGQLERMLQLGKLYEMHVSDRFVMIMAPGFRDGVHAVIPVEKIVAAEYSYSRPLWALVVAFVFIFVLMPLTANIWPLPLVSTGVGLYLIYFHYWKRRTIQVTVSSGEGPYGFRYLVGEVGSLEKAAETVDVIRNLIIDKNAGTRMLVSSGRVPHSQVTGSAGRQRQVEFSMGEQGGIEVGFRDGESRDERPDVEHVIHALERSESPGARRSE